MEPYICEYEEYLMMSVSKYSISGPFLEKITLKLHVSGYIVQFPAICRRHQILRMTNTVTCNFHQHRLAGIIHTNAR